MKVSRAALSDMLDIKGHRTLRSRIKREKGTERQTQTQKLLDKTTNRNHEFN